MGKFIFSSDDTKLIYYFVDYDNNLFVKQYYDFEKISTSLYSFLNTNSIWPWSFDYSAGTKLQVKKAIICALEFENKIDYYFGDTFTIIYSNGIITIELIIMNNTNNDISLQINLNNYLISTNMIDLKE